MYVRWVVVGLVAAIAPAVFPAAAGTIDQGLQETLASLSDDQLVSTLVYVNGAVDLNALSADLNRVQATLQRRHEDVVIALQTAAQLSQPALLNHLEQLLRAGRIQSYTPFWIADAIRVDATKAEILKLASHPSVNTILFNYEIELIRPVSGRGLAQRAEPLSPRTPEIGLVAIRAPEVWALGIDGTGVLVATLDTGVDGNHPALHDRWRGLDPNYAGHPQWAWFDPVTHTTFPQSFGSHGTHTMGTVCGGAPGDQVGVAPGVQWIHAAVIDRVSIQQTVADAIAAFQWLLDPDGNPATNWDVPSVCSNSWGVTTGHGYPPCDQTFWTHLDACEAAGIVILFSAGNEGPASESLRRPSDRATDAYRTTAVGALDANTQGWPVAGFSSRGPSHCTPDGTATIKPEVSAPGVDVRSSVPGGGYAQWGWSGTSMASPHVNGVVAMMRQACPDLPVETIKQILFDTAVDLGPVGEDNDYGWGIVDAYEAVLAAQEACGPHPPKALPGTFDAPTFATATMALAATDDGLPDPPATMSYVIKSLPAQGQLSDPGAGSITAVPYTLVNYGNQVNYRSLPYYQGQDAFTFAATDHGTPPEGGEGNTATATVEVGLPLPVYTWNLDTNPNWYNQYRWNWGHPNGSAGDHGGPDPIGGHTGPKCYAYNLYGGYTNNLLEWHLTTRAIDCTGFTHVRLRFWRWLGVQAGTHDHAYVRVSTDQSHWTTVWKNPDNETIDDQAWTLQECNISAVANNQPEVYIRWTMGPTDSEWTMCGWNIDDIEILGLAPSNIRIGDLNCDGTVDFDDIDPFVLILSDLPAWQAAYPGCDWHNGDCNGDGGVDFGDLNAFVGLLAR